MSAGDSETFNNIRRRITRHKPRIVCFCGSTKFMDIFREQNLKWTLAGNIVLTVGCDIKSDGGLLLGEDAKLMLDQLHFRKIEMADVVYVLNVGGYVGESTKNEIAYAKSLLKEILYLEQQEVSNG